MSAKKKSPGSSSTLANRVESVVEKPKADPFRKGNAPWRVKNEVPHGRLRGDLRRTALPNRAVSSKRPTRVRARSRRRDRDCVQITSSNRGCDVVNTVPIAGRLLQLRCATCNKVQEPSSRKAIGLFADAHWFHAGYTLLVDLAEPAELAWNVVDIQTRGI
jgi:hypothetical protein